MKAILWTSLSATAGLFMSIASFSAPKAAASTQLITVNPEAVFIPTGFTSNDNAQITIAGNHPTYCYESAEPIADLDAQTRQITIKAQANYDDKAVCLLTLRPYFQTIDFGKLAEGEYRVWVENSDGRKTPSGTLHISAPQTGPRRSPYAPVEDASIHVSAPEQIELKLTGSFPVNCMRIDRVRILQIGTHMMEVYPFMERIPGRPCEPVTTPWEMTFQLRSKLTGKTLIHVRSYNGHALNKVVDLR